LLNMNNAYKKWLINSGSMRVVFVMLYLLAIFAVPLSHTCHSSDKDVHDHQSSCDSHPLDCDASPHIGLVTTFCQYDSVEADESHSQHCMACMHSITSKTFKLCSDSLYVTQTVVSTQVLAQSSFVMQFQWLVSAPLRAPPSMTS